MSFWCTGTMSSDIGVFVLLYVKQIVQSILKSASSAPDILAVARLIPDDIDQEFCIAIGNCNMSSFIVGVRVYHLAHLDMFTVVAF